MGMSELWSQEGTFERALFTLRKYGRLHITSYHLYWNIQDLFAFGLSLSFKAFTSPCPFPCFLILSVFHCFPTAEVPMRRAYSVAAIQGLWPKQQIVNAVRTSIALAYRRTIPMLLGFSGRFADLGVSCICQSQKVKSCVLSSRFTSFSKHAWHVWAPDSSCASDRNEKLQFQLLRHSEEFIRD